MDALQCRYRLYRLRFAAGMNQRYYQILEFRWAAADRAARIAVALLAAAGVVAASSASAGPAGSAALAVAVMSLAAAVVLNVVPFGAGEKRQTDLFRRWSELREQVEALEVGLEGRPVDESIEPHLVERVRDLVRRKNAILAVEPAAWAGLLDRCEEDQTEEVWGAGIRTAGQRERERARREAAIGSEAAGARDRGGSAAG